MKRTITVTGKANLSVSPDTVVLGIEIDTLKETYDEARELSLRLYNQIEQIVSESKLPEKSLKTKSYSIETRYSTRKIKDGEWKKFFEGYALKHSMSLTFDIDPTLLGTIVSNIDKCEVKPDINIAYTVKDTTDAKDQLLVKAVESSKRKAVAMTQAACVELGDVVSINYSWGEMRIYSEEMELTSMCSEVKESSMCFTPEDIDISDSVTIVWEIK